MSSSVHVEESVQIARAPAEVWDAIADYSFDLEWRKGLSDMTPEPRSGLKKDLQKLQGLLESG